MVEKLQDVGKPFYCILGNDDWFDIENEHCLKSGDVINQFNVTAFNFVGSTPFNTNREVNENKIEYELNKSNITNGCIVLAHCPPRGYQDRINSGERVGSKSIAKYILKVKPKIWLCGHIHEDFGVSQLGETLIFNCACDHITDRFCGFIIDVDSLNYEMI